MELMIISGPILMLLFNVVDVGTYTYQRMQVEEAAQIGVQKVYASCTSSSLPAVQNCNVGTLSSTITTAVQSTSLGSNVSVVSGYPIEGYYCLDASNTLTLVGQSATIGGTPTKPASCVAAGLPAGRMGDYIQIRVTYGYTSVFSWVSVAGLLSGPITKTAWMPLA